LAALACALACARPAAPPALPEPVPVPPPPPEAREPVPARACLRIERIVVHKGERRLWASCAGGAVVELPVALGRAPEGAKRAAGDQRTPEGDYRVVGPARRSRFHRFLPIDYPSRADAERAFAEGRLSRRDHDRILAAHQRGIPPPDDTPLGGHIGFHGEGARWRGESRTLDWTEGCIALSDSDLDFVIARSGVGTVVTILEVQAPLPLGSMPEGGAAAPR
jgi:murein L,D-transpeptidase YafK